MCVCVVRWGAFWAGVVWVCCASTASVAGLEPSYDDYYDNEITQGHEEEGASPAARCQAADLPRWDRLFVALEDSHMRQNMLLEALERCCGGALSLRAQLEQLVKGACQRYCSPDLGSACRGQAEKSSLRLLRGLLAEMREEGAARERRTNATLQRLLEGSRELSTRLQRLEENNARRGEAHAADVPMGAGLGRTEPMMTQRPGGPRGGGGAGLKTFSSDRKRQQGGKLAGEFGMMEEGQHGERIKECEMKDP